LSLHIVFAAAAGPDGPGNAQNYISWENVNALLVEVGASEEQRALWDSVGLSTCPGPATRLSLYSHIQLILSQNGGMDASKKRKLMAIGGLNTCFKQDEAMLADISAIASRLAVGNDMCEDQCPNAPNLLAAHRLLVDDVVDHSTAPDQEAGYSSPEIHAMLQQDLGKEIFYKWRRGDLAQQELTRLVLECLVTRRVVAADNKEAAELSLNNSWQAFAGMDEEDKLFWEDGHWYVMAQCTHTRARSVSFSLARSLSLALSLTHTHTHTRYYVVSLFCIVTMSPCFYSRFALGRVRPQVARCVVAISMLFPTTILTA
jgi:hypothetical protein